MCLPSPSGTSLAKLGCEGEGDEPPWALEGDLTGGLSRVGCVGEDFGGLGGGSFATTIWW